MTEGAAAPHVELSGIVKRFAHAIANDGASLAVGAGEIHALVGENGAGKSTLMHVLYGLVRPDAGRVRVGEGTGPFPSPREAIAAGVGMVHQHFMLVGPMTILENVFLGIEPVRAARLDWSAARERLLALAAEHGFEIDPDARVDGLGVGVQQRVEILKVLVRGARVLVLDEPTAVLTPDEASGLFRVLRGLATGGASVILITHRLEEVVRVADRVTVMRRGRTIATHEVAETTRERLAAEMVGRALRAPEPPGEPPVTTETVLDVRDLSVGRGRGGHALEGVSFTLGQGEVLGVAGVEGNGQTELAELLAGLRRPSRGRILLDGEDVTDRGRARRLARGLAFVPEDRLDRGLVRDFTLAENFVLGRQRRKPFARGPVLDRVAITVAADAALAAFDVRPADPAARTATLSGGNQQKLVMARELGGAVRVLVAAQPTRGVDVGAIEAIHDRVREVARAGAGVLLISAELEELLLLSHRIIVLYRGRIAGETSRAEADVAALGRWMLGGGERGVSNGGGAERGDTRA